MLAFDALIGSQDRHPENWGIIQDVKDVTTPPRFAPIYDTARGLLGEYSDEVLQRATSGGQKDAARRYLENYAWRSKPIFTCANRRGERVTQFELIAHVVADPVLSPLLAPAVRELIGGVDLDAVRSDLKREVGAIVSQLRLDLILRLLEMRYKTLRELVVTGRGSKP